MPPGEGLVMPPGMGTGFDGTWPQIPPDVPYVAGQQYTPGMFPGGPDPLSHGFHKERGFFGGDDVFIGDNFNPERFGARQALNQKDMIRKRRVNEKFSRISRGR
jgi:hypothetical protein